MEHTRRCSFSCNIYTDYGYFTIGNVAVYDWRNILILVMAGSSLRDGVRVRLPSGTLLSFELHVCILQLESDVR